jgi:hypothetical protein
MRKSSPMPAAMSTLLNLQMQLCQAVLGGGTAEIVATIRGDGLDPAARVGKPLSYVENPGFPRGCARRAWRPGRQRRSVCFDSAPTCGNISLGPYSSTGVPVTVVGENTLPAPTKSGVLRGQRAVDPQISEFGSDSTKAEHGPLIVPGKRQT